MKQPGNYFGGVGDFAPMSEEELAADLRRYMKDYIEDYKFKLVSQPIYDFSAGRICGYEILSRLDHSEYGTVSPGQFLPIINELKLHAEFDCHIFYESCRWMSDLLRSDKPIDWLSINFSRKTLGNAGIVEKLVKVADSFGVPHDRMGIELTEYEDTDNAAQFRENMRALKKAGFLILVDDMGSGVTSSRDLLDFPVDIVKLDRSLLLTASTEEGKRSFKRLTQIIRTLGMRSLCEGIERINDLQFVQDAGCTYGQGFFFAPPASTESVEAMMNRKPR